FGVRVPAALALIVLLASFWGYRAARKLFQMVETRRRARREPQRLPQEDTPLGIVAETGMSLGRPVATLRSGAFPGYRPFEPGDRLASALLEDLILLSRGGRAVIPRIALRLDDRSTRLTIYVHAGRSMRVPSGGGGVFPKVEAAGVVAELLADA